MTICDEACAARHADWRIEPSRRAIGEPGLSILMRIRDEAGWLPTVLPPLFEVADEIVLVDNASTDGSADVARGVAEAHGYRSLRMHDYPWRIARVGAEHEATDAGSVHSLVFLNDWTLSHARYAVCWKWDGDMLATEAGLGFMSEAKRALPLLDVVVTCPSQLLFVDRRTDVAYLDASPARFAEVYGFTNVPGRRFEKVARWERVHVGDAIRIVGPAPFFLEMKEVSLAEFDHWTSIADIGPERRRKHRELEVITALGSGRMPRDLVEIGPAEEELRRRSTAATASSRRRRRMP